MFCSVVLKFICRKNPRSFLSLSSSLQAVVAPENLVQGFSHSPGTLT